jgi:hypothetical protein
LCFSKDIINRKEVNDLVVKYLNSRRIGLGTAQSLGVGFIPKGMTTIMPRTALIPKVKQVLNCVNGALIFPSFKSISIESFLGILRNIVNIDSVKHIIWKMNNDGNRFFYWGEYPESVTLVEGVSDKMRLMQGDISAIPTNGTEFDIYKIKEEFSKASEISLFLDGDRAGKFKTLELVFNYLAERKNFDFDLTVVKSPKDLDPCDLTEKKVVNLYNNRELAEDYFKEVIKNSLDEDDKIQKLVLLNLEKNFNRRI